MSSVKLKHIDIYGYKSIDYNSPLRLDLHNVNILLGANGSGKSNIISFFKMLNYMMSGSLQRFIAQNGGSQKFLHYGPKHTPALRGTVVLSQNAKTDVYDFTLSNAVADQLIITNEKVSFKKANNTEAWSKDIVSNFKESGLIEQKNLTIKTIRKMLSQCKAYQFHDSSLSGVLRQSSHIDAAQYLQSEGNNLAAYLFFLKHNYEESYKNIVSYVHLVMPQFGDFYLNPVNNYVALNWQDNSANDYVFTSDQFSDGTIRFIALATLLLQPANLMPSVIIIDEPELGLHPSALDQLSEMIKDASIHSQIIIATQSAQLIDDFPLEDISIIEEDKVKYSTICRQLKEKDFKLWLEEYTNSELWRKNVIGGQPL